MSSFVAFKRQLATDLEAFGNRKSRPKYNGVNKCVKKPCVRILGNISQDTHEETRRGDSTLHKLSSVRNVHRPSGQKNNNFPGRKLNYTIPSTPPSSRQEIRLTSSLEGLGISSWTRDFDDTSVESENLSPAQGVLSKESRQNTPGFKTPVILHSRDLDSRDRRLFPGRHNTPGFETLCLSPEVLLRQEGRLSADLFPLSRNTPGFVTPSDILQESIGGTLSVGLFPGWPSTSGFEMPCSHDSRGKRLGSSTQSTIRGQSVQGHFSWIRFPGRRSTPGLETPCLSTEILHRQELWCDSHSKRLGSSTQSTIRGQSVQDHFSGIRFPGRRSTPGLETPSSSTEILHRQELWCDTHSKRLGSSTQSIGQDQFVQDIFSMELLPVRHNTPGCETPCLLGDSCDLLDRTLSSSTQSPKREKARLKVVVKVPRADYLEPSILLSYKHGSLRM